MAEFVQVRNPANGNVGRVPKRAFENTFKDKGFELVMEDEGSEDEALDAPSFLDDDEEDDVPLDEDE